MDRGDLMSKPQNLIEEAWDKYVSLCNAEKLQRHGEPVRAALEYLARKLAEVAGNAGNDFSMTRIREGAALAKHKILKACGLDEQKG